MERKEKEKGEGKGWGLAYVCDVDEAWHGPDQEGSDPDMASEGSKEQRRGPCHRDGTRVRPGLKEHSRRPFVPSIRRRNEGRVPGVVPRVDRGSGLEQQLHDGTVPLVSSRMQGGIALCVAAAALGRMKREEAADSGSIPLVRCLVQVAPALDRPGEEGTAEGVPFRRRGGNRRQCRHWRARFRGRIEPNEGGRVMKGGASCACRRLTFSQEGSPPFLSLRAALRTDVG